MSQALRNDRKMMLLCIAAAATTVVAGILHLIMVPRAISHNPGEGVLFLVGGALQVFWALPVMQRWGRIWQIIGIVGTAVFVALWLSDRLHLIPESGMPRPGVPGDRPRGNAPGIGIGWNPLSIETCQIAFIGLYSAISRIISKQKTA
ncbi:MAG TPA: hypothetical protein VLF17_05275 [Candidatus Nitrosotenuis sp.]|nr:hypothetical protein [Candidatus Nitrosotenuis sp.]